MNPRRFPETWKPFPDTVEALKALKSRYELSIITDALVGNLLRGIQGETKYEAGQASRS